ncbi:hypothetical protein PV371_27290 [Streptomyces sp. TX20-6-3]|uniref:hypothetical protein n=1 Tax=Streptomyces sp. TX20-6-3 TaxID=3028705 RepID=UPI0029AE211A|nr:hypothetical protein [Streptomyces sp. TX20-6-3]MDX2563332.1 hypothetical protein [Streptomyces sp. TX20-6-3]
MTQQGTPSQAEGDRAGDERSEEEGRQETDPGPERTTPSQAEGEREEEDDQATL